MKRLAVVATSICLLLLFCVPAQAEENEEWQAAVDAFELHSLEEATPDDVLMIIDDLEIAPDKVDGVDVISVWDAIKTRISEVIADELAPLKTLRLLIGLAAVAFLGRAITVESNGWQERVAELLTLSACAAQQGRTDQYDGYTVRTEKTAPPPAAVRETELPATRALDDGGRLLVRPDGVSAIWGRTWE